MAFDSRHLSEIDSIADRAPLPEDAEPVPVGELLALLQRLREELDAFCEDLGIARQDPAAGAGRLRR